MKTSIDFNCLLFMEATFQLHVICTMKNMIQEQDIIKTIKILYKTKDKKKLLQIRYLQ